MHGPRREGWAPLPPAEEPGRGRRRQVEEVEGEAAAGARRARGEEAAAGPSVAVATAERPRGPRGGGAATGRLGRGAARSGRIWVSREGRASSSKSCFGLLFWNPTSSKSCFEFTIPTATFLRWTDQSGGG
jgi:hypothetical protein